MVGSALTLPVSACAPLSLSDEGSRRHPLPSGAGCGLACSRFSPGRQRLQQVEKGRCECCTDPSHCHSSGDDSSDRPGGPLVSSPRWSPLSQANDTGRAPSATVAFIAGDTNRYVARSATGRTGQYVHLSYAITEARHGYRTVTYAINKYVRAPHTDVIRCKQRCSGYAVATLWDKLRHARFVGRGSVTVRVWKS